MSGCKSCFHHSAGFAVVLFFSRFVFSLSNEVLDRVKGSNPGKVLGLVWSTQLAINRQSLAIHLFFFFFLIYFWLCWVFVSVRGLSLVVASGDQSSSWCAGLSLLRPFLLRSTGSRRAGSVTVAHRPSCSAACGILPDQDSNLCPLHWQADSQPLRRQRSPSHSLLLVISVVGCRHR